APVTEGKSLEEKLKSMNSVWPFALLFLLSIGGIYQGFFTPTEAGGVGALGACLLAVFTRRLRWHDFKASLNETTRLTALIFFILIGSEIFRKFLAISRIPVATTRYVAQLNMSPMVILTFILIVYFILALFLEGLAIFVLTLPVVYPLITLRSEEHTSELQSRFDIVCRLLLEKKKKYH